MYRIFFENYNDSSESTLTNAQLQQTRYKYAAENLLREVQLTSENLRKWEILESGASSHFILSTAPVLNENIVDKRFKVRLPDRRTVCLSHMGTLPLTQLPISSRITNIIPGMEYHSLMSVYTFPRRM